jgi:hypothetical protein
MTARMIMATTTARTDAAVPSVRLKIRYTEAADALI